MPSVSDADHSYQLERYGGTIVSGLVTKTDNIDISSNGQSVLVSEEIIYILTPALGLSPILSTTEKIKSYHDPSQDIVLFSCSIQIKDCPQDVSKAGSRGDAYLLAYEPRFMDAKWSPTPFGPIASPVLAALTTQFQILLFTAATNQYAGPWKQTTVLEGGEDQHIVSIAWLELDEELAWLIAGTRQGSILAWLMQGDKAVFSSHHDLRLRSITSLYRSEADHLAIVTAEGLYIAQVSKSASHLNIQVATLRPPLPSGSNISTARWHGSHLLYCTPGAAHLIDVISEKSGTVLLENIEDDSSSCSLRPAAAIKHERLTQVWRISLQDGSEYQISTSQFLDDTEHIKPTTYLTPANEAIGTLQRTVEATQGLYAKVEDGSGLVFLCHDANSIASWSYFRDPKCQFGISLTNAPKQSQELQKASILILAALEGELIQLRALIMYYLRSRKKAEWISLIIYHLERACKERATLQGAIRLCAWIQREQVKDRVKTQVHTRLVDLGSASILLSNVVSILTSPEIHTGTSIDSASVSFGAINCKIAQRVAERTDDKALLEAVTRLTSLLSSTKSTEGNHVGERCPACTSEILIDDDAALLARCQKGHLWKRCSSTFTILTTNYNMICSICSRESTRIDDATSTAQKELLSRYKSCRMCDGKLVL